VLAIWAIVYWKQGKAFEPAVANSKGGKVARTASDHAIAGLRPLPEYVRPSAEFIERARRLLRAVMNGGVDKAA
jgi:hypothetical protein